MVLPPPFQALTGGFSAPYRNTVGTAEFTACPTDAMNMPSPNGAQVAIKQNLDNVFSAFRERA